MAALDTSVLVRFFVGDDRKQFQLAKAYIEGVAREKSLFFPLSVSIELEWVLRSPNATWNSVKGNSTKQTFARNK